MKKTSQEPGVSFEIQGFLSQMSRGKHSHINHKAFSPGGNGAGGCREKVLGLFGSVPVWKWLSVCFLCGAELKWDCHIEFLKTFFEAPVVVTPFDITVCLPFQ